jgi:hypothetical protein
LSADPIWRTGANEAEVAGIFWMRTLNSRRILGGLVLAALFVATQARAIIAYEFPGTMVGNQYAGQGATPLILGNEFVVNSPISVTALGAFNSGNAGFWNGATAVTVPVAIYQLTAGVWNQVSGTSLSFSGDAGSLVGSARFQNLVSPVTLNPGTYAIVAANYNAIGAQAWNASVNPAAPHPVFQTTSDAITMALDGAFSGVGTTLGGTLSDLSYGAYDASIPQYAGATFDFTPVPEVATFGVAAVSLLGLVYFGRYAGRRRKLGLV